MQRKLQTFHNLNQSLLVISLCILKLTLDRFICTCIFQLYIYRYIINVLWKCFVDESNSGEDNRGTNDVHADGTNGIDDSGDDTTDDDGDNSADICTNISEVKVVVNGGEVAGCSRDDIDEEPEQGYHGMKIK